MMIKNRAHRPLIDNPLAACANLKGRPQDYTNGLVSGSVLTRCAPVWHWLLGFYDDITHGRRGRASCAILSRCLMDYVPEYQDCSAATPHGWHGGLSYEHWSTYGHAIAS